MTLPAVKSKIGEGRPSRSLPSSTGTAFIVARADRGPVTAPVLVRSLAEAVTNFGPRVSYSPLYDTLDVAFNEGLDHAYVVRCVGPAAVIASKKLTAAGPVDVLEATATSPGVWGNSIKVKTVAGVVGGFYKLQVLYNDVLVESSPELETNAAAVSWAAKSAYIRLKELTATDPTAAQTVALASGADDGSNVNAEVITKGLALFTPDLGAGQVAVPGNTAEAVLVALEAHCFATQRTPVPDVEDTANVETLLAAAGALRAATAAKQGGLFGPWDIAPGSAPNTTRTVPPCARQLGAMARVDAETGDAGTAAAGPQGKARYVIGLSQTFTDAQREELNNAGVNVSILDEGVPTTYGWRTLANSVTDPGWVPLSSARLMLGIAHGAKSVLKRRLFAKTDAQRNTVSKAQGDIENEVIKPLYGNRSLYGETEAEACSVTVTQEVSPTDGSVAKLAATIVARPTKYAEVIELTVVETNEAL